MEQGQIEDGRSGCYRVEDFVGSILGYMGHDEGLCPRFFGRRVRTKPDGIPWINDDYWLVRMEDMAALLGYVCPRLRRRRELYAERTQLEERHQEAMAENARLASVHVGLRQDIAEARQKTKEARVEASSTHEKLEETKTAFAEAEKHFIRAPDLVSSLRSLTNEVKTLQENVRTSWEKTAEALAERPTGGRRSEKTLSQMKRVLHNIGRFPRRRRAKAADAAADGGGAIKCGRICYICRCKGHLAKDCPQTRTCEAIESSNAMTSNTQPRVGESDAEASSTGWNSCSGIERTFTSGIG